MAAPCLRRRQIPKASVSVDPSPEEPVRGDADEEFAVDVRVNPEAERGAVDAGAVLATEPVEIGKNGGLRAVAGPPGPVAGHLGGQILDDGVEDHAIAALAGHRRIGL